MLATASAVTKARPQLVLAAMLGMVVVILSVLCYVAGTRRILAGRAGLARQQVGLDAPCDVLTHPQESRTREFLSCLL